MTAPREAFTMWVRWQAKPQSNLRMEVGCLYNQHLIREWSFHFHLCLFPDPIPQGEVRVWKVNSSQMPKDLMNCYLWWSLHRLQQSSLFMVFQGTEINPGKNMGILHHGSLGPVQQPAQRPLILPSPPRDHSPHCSPKNPVSKWILSHGSHDQSLIDWESDSDV